MRCADVDADVVACADLSRRRNLRSVDARHEARERRRRRTAVGRNPDRTICAGLKAHRDDVARGAAIDEVAGDADHRRQAGRDVGGIRGACLLDAHAAAVDQQVVVEVGVILPPDGLLARRRVDGADVVQQARFEVAEGDGFSVATSASKLLQF